MSDDLIRRQDAIDALGEEPEVWSENDDYELGLNNQWHYDVYALKAVPSAQTERKRGKWVDPAAIDVYRCSVCEEYTQLEVPRLFYHYCPNCGAEMEAGDGEKIH